MDDSVELRSLRASDRPQVADVLTVTKSSVSMAIAIAEMIGPELVRAIGPAHGVGRPRWEALGRAIEENGLDRARLIEIAEKAYGRAEVAMLVEDVAPAEDPSVEAFEAVAKAVLRPAKRAKTPSPARASGAALTIGGKRGGAVKRTAKGLSIELAGGEFADWIEAEVHDLIEELHERWKQRTED